MLKGMTCFAKLKNYNEKKLVRNERNYKNFY